MTFQLMLFPNFREKAFTMSYDDGVLQDIRLIGIMQKNGLRGTFNLSSGTMHWESKVKPEAVCGLYVKNGHEVAAHGVNHLAMTAVSENRIVDEVIGDRRALEAITGNLVTGMAYANGRYDDTVVDILKKCGITYARTVADTGTFEVSDDWLRLRPTCHHNDGRLFDLADAFLADTPEQAYVWANNPKLFYLWGHSFEFDNDRNWERIEAFAEKIGNHDSVWYATNGEIVRYVEAFKALRYSVDGKIICNPTDTDVYMRTTAGTKVMVPAGQCVRAET